MRDSEHNANQGMQRRDPDAWQRPAPLRMSPMRPARVTPRGLLFAFYFAGLAAIAVIFCTLY